MSKRVLISNMKINHRSRKSHMSEALLHVHYVLSVFQEMRGRTMPQVVDGDGMVECDPRQCVLEDDSHIAWSDALWLYLASMTLEDIVVARILLPICLEHDEHLVGNGHISGDSHRYCRLHTVQTHLLSKKRNAVPEFDEVSRLVQCCIGHGNLWWRGLMTGVVRNVPSSSFTF